jgi:hypothetical protein
MSHSSVNFDKTGFTEDVNIVFPIDRFSELSEGGQIGSLASVHYSFMGAGLMPRAYAESASQVAGLLKQDTQRSTWDNRRVLHRRDDSDPQSRRLMKRCQVLARTDSHRSAP